MTRLTPERKEYIRGGKCWDSHPDRVYRELINEIDALESELKDSKSERDSFESATYKLMNEFEKLLDVLKKIPSKIQTGIPYGPIRGPIVDEVCDLIFEALSKYDEDNK